MTQGGIGLALHNKNFVDGYAGAQRLNDRIAAFNHAVIFRFDGSGAAQGSPFFHEIPPECRRRTGSRIDS